MIFVRSASISNRWRQSFKSVSVRYLSRISEVHEDSPSEVPGSPNPSTPDSLFGIAPRKLRNVEDEDFSPNYSQPNKTGNSSEISSQQNYFSQAWAAEKQRPLSRNSDRMEEQLLQVPTAQQSSLQSWTQSRVWLTAPNSQVSTQERFVFVSFKVLASANVSKHRGQLYGHVPNQMLDWRTRRKKLIFELELCSPDIICLQEVDRFQDLQSDLAARGYEGIYKVRTGAAPDGCAIFWRKKRFRLLHEESLEFCETGMRDNIAQFCVLKSVASGASDTKDTLDSKKPDEGKNECIIVGNINVLFNPRRGDMKLGQCRVFLEQAHKLSSSWQGAPLVIGGCFNCTPESLMYDYLSKGELDLFGLDRRYISGQLAAAAVNVASKFGNETKKPGTSSLRETLASLETEEPDRSLSERLRTSLMARSSSEQDRSVKEFALSAKRILGVQSKEKDSSTSSIDNNKHESKTEVTGPNLFVSKTIEVLEGSLSSNSKHADEQKTVRNAVDVLDLSSSTRSNTMDSLLSVQIDKDTKFADDGLKTSLEPMVSEKQYETGDVTTVNSNVVNRGNISQVEESSNDVVDELKVVDDESITSSKSLVNDKEPTIACEADGSTIGPDQSTEPGHGWEMDSLKLASGSLDCTVIKHKLKLHSVYPEIQGRADTRDAKGEPLMTMYHRQFRGTVDYIWRSDGLETTKVLDMVPLKSMLVTPGLPSMVHGSDHIALACELSFGDRRMG